MNFRVIWTRLALDQLMNLWLAATHREDVTAASNRIDGLLARDPLHQGESRAGSDRLLIERPLAVLYRVDVAAQVVHIFAVGPSRSH